MCFVPLFWLKNCSLSVLFKNLLRRIKKEGLRYWQAGLRYWQAELRCWQAGLRCWQAGLGFIVAGFIEARTKIRYSHAASKSAIYWNYSWSGFKKKAGPWLDGNMVYDRWCWSSRCDQLNLIAQKWKSGNLIVSLIALFPPIDHSILPYWSL